VFAREPRPLEAFRGARAAVNTPESMSGMLALKLVFAPLAAGGRFFGSAVLTGGHLASLAALRKGEADVCAVDAVCVELARRHRPELLDGAVEIARSPLVPGLPYVTAATRPPEEIAALRGALDRALCDPELADARRMLLIAGATPLGAEDYRTILDREHELETAGGIRLFEHKGL
jgi:ABC-type phosphate/phosphonate transport system substrate-binding protein